MLDESALQGWEPVIGSDASLEEVINSAFEYRGDVTIDKVDGDAVVGYLFNRNAAALTPFVEVIELETGGRLRLPYTAIRNIRFTGRDTAAGQSRETSKQRQDTQAQSH